MSARYVTGAEAWLLTALAFIILWVFWRLLNLAADLIGYGRCLCSKGGGPPSVPAARVGAMSAAPFRCTGRDARNAQKGPDA